ncbi:hypothetical protein T439DRAFT_93472 [Meredithblackwellia eburnea MCA 4105]
MAFRMFRTRNQRARGVAGSRFAVPNRGPTSPTMRSFTVNGAPVGAVAILLAVFSSMGGFIFGYDTGQISDFLLMPDFLLRFATCTEPGNSDSCTFSNVRTGLIVAMLSIGTAIGALGGAPIADMLGRRKGIATYCAVVIVGTIIQVASVSSWVQLMIGRIVTGLGIGALSIGVPLYQSESSPKEIRGSLVATYQLFITFGILIAYCISIGTRYITGSASSASWRIVCALNMLWALILGIGILFAPESPRWLMAHDFPEEAEQSLARLRGVKVEDNDFSVRQAWVEIEEAIKKERQTEAVSWIGCFKPHKKTLYRTLLLMALQSLQQLTGANYFFYYGATIFKSVGITDSFVTQIILGAVNFVCTFFGIYVMERFGRRVPLIIGGVWQSMWLFVFAAAGTAKDPQNDKNIGTLMIVSACLFIAGYASTWAPAIWILVAESFPTNSRAKQGALATASNWTWNFLIGFFTPFITGAINYRYGFIFAACNLTGAIVVYLFLYESSKLSLEAVDNMYNDPDTKAWNSAKWVPAGHSSRADFNEAIEAEKKAAAASAIQHHENAPDADSQSQHTAVDNFRASGEKKRDLNP